MANVTAKLFVLFALVAFVAATQYLSDYNAIILGTISSTSSDCEGRLVAGGNADLKYYAVGSRLTHDCSRIDLQIGGNFNGDNGQASRGLTTVGGTSHTVSWGTPCGSIVNSPISFDINSVFSDFSADSTEYGSKSTTGSITTSFEDLYLSGTETINYFNVDGSILPTISGIHIDIPSDSWAVVNIHGDDLEFFDKNFFLSSTTDRQKVLYNFPEATKIYAARISFQGSILAPSATLYYENGNIEGSVACANYHGSGEFHNYPYIPPTSTCHCVACDKTITVPSAELFSLFILTDITSSTTDFEGRVAAGGNVNFNFVGVGSKTPDSNGERDDLIVKGDLYFHDGEVSGGNVVIQGSADVERLGIPQGQLINAPVNVNFFLDFLGLTVISELLSVWSTNGQAITSYSTLDLYGSDYYLNVFSIDYTTLQSARTIVLSVPTSSHVIINVNGASIVNFENAGIVLNGSTPDKVLWNFYNTAELFLNSIQIEGSLLAPLTDVTFNNGNLNGAIFAHSYTGNGEIHLASWIPLPIPCTPCDC